MSATKALSNLCLFEISKRVMSWEETTLPSWALSVKTTTRISGSDTVKRSFTFAHDDSFAQSAVLSRFLRFLPSLRL